MILLARFLLDAGYEIGSVGADTGRTNKRAAGNKYRLTAS